MQRAVAAQVKHVRKAATRHLVLVTGQGKRAPTNAAPVTRVGSNLVQRRPATVVQPSDNDALDISVNDSLRSSNLVQSLKALPETCEWLRILCDQLKSVPSANSSTASFETLQQLQKELGALGKRTGEVSHRFVGWWKSYQVALATNDRQALSQTLSHLVTASRDVLSVAATLSESLDRISERATALARTHPNDEAVTNLLQDIDELKRALALLAVQVSGWLQATMDLHEVGEVHKDQAVYRLDIDATKRVQHASILDASLDDSIETNPNPIENPESKSAESDKDPTKPPSSSTGPADSSNTGAATNAQKHDTLGIVLQEAAVDIIRVCQYLSAPNSGEAVARSLISSLADHGLKYGIPWLQSAFSSWRHRDVSLPSTTFSGASSGTHGIATTPIRQRTTTFSTYSGNIASTVVSAVGSTDGSQRLASGLVVHSVSAGIRAVAGSTVQSGFMICTSVVCNPNVESIAKDAVNMAAVEAAKYLVTAAVVAAL